MVSAVFLLAAAASENKSILFYFLVTRGFMA